MGKIFVIVKVTNMAEDASAELQKRVEEEFKKANSVMDVLQTCQDYRIGTLLMEISYARSYIDSDETLESKSQIYLGI